MDEVFEDMAMSALMEAGLTEDEAEMELENFCDRDDLPWEYAGEPPKN